MNLLQPWNLIFFVGFIVFYWTRHIFITRTRQEKKVVSKMDGLEKVLLALMVPTSLILPVLYLFTALLSFADYDLPTSIRCLGAGTMIASLYLFCRSHVDLGQNWSVSLEIREGHQLVTNGVYRFIRHPMYASLWLWGIAQGTLLPNWLAGWSFMIAFGLMYFIRTPREEALMGDRFGDDYREYRRKTGRVIPRIFPPRR